MTKRLFLTVLCLPVLVSCAKTAVLSPSEPQFIPVPPPVAGKSKPLTEYSAPELTETFGVPSFVRQEGEREMWRYDVGACKIFFFFDRTGGQTRLQMYESTPPGKPGQMDRNCFSAFELRIRKKTG